MYYFIECGFDNVWFENGYEEKDIVYGKVYVVKFVESLLCEIVM